MNELASSLLYELVLAFPPPFQDHKSDPWDIGMLVHTILLICSHLHGMCSHPGTLQ